MPRDVASGDGAEVTLGRYGILGVERLRMQDDLAHMTTSAEFFLRLEGLIKRLGFRDHWTDLGLPSDVHQQSTGDHPPATFAQQSHPLAHKVSCHDVEDDVDTTTGEGACLLDDVLRAVDHLMSSSFAYCDSCRIRSARMHIALRTETVTRAEAARLLTAPQEAMGAALEAGGASFAEGPRVAS